MIAKLKRLKRGFTLVELMIVVAIIGILAALAIYGVTKYVKNAKTAEARDALGRMAKDATAAYNRESMSSKVMTAGSTTGISHQLCGSASAVPTGAAPKAAKYQSSPTDWMSGSATAGWTCLKFSMDDPQYFQYNYQATDRAAGPFTAIAKGNLDGDDAESTFTLGGGIDVSSGKAVAIVAPNIGEDKPDE
jgi:type IV pilus assembly protein PilA